MNDMNTHEQYHKLRYGSETQAEVENSFSLTIAGSSYQLYAL